jgi:hypothetical protein
VGSGIQLADFLEQGIPLGTVRDIGELFFKAGPFGWDGSQDF